MFDLVSIITPAYNASKFIEQCVYSVINQSYMNWEMIIIDDCSDTQTKQKIEALAKLDKRIQPIYLKENVGAAQARNRAIKIAKGRYIAFLDADDYWCRDKLEKQIAFMQEKDIAFSFTSYQPVSEDGSKEFTIIKAPKKMTYNSYLKNTIIGCLTVIIDVHKVGCFKMPEIRSSHDMALWLLIMKKGFPAFGLNKNLARYRIVSTSNTSSKINAIQDVWKVYREIEGLSFFYSCFCFLNYVFNALIKRL